MEWLSYIATLLKRLTQKKVKFLWFDACEVSFEKLKDNMTYAPVLTLLEGTDGLVEYCDISRMGQGSVLIWYGKVVAYASRKLKVHERNYLTHNLELEIVIFELIIWLHYLYWLHMDIYSDQKRLHYVFKLKKLNLK